MYEQATDLIAEIKYSRATLQMRHKVSWDPNTCTYLKSDYYLCYGSNEYV